MIESDLQPGDVIFFTNIYKDTNEPEVEQQSYVDHVGLFIGFDEHNNPLIVHSITGSKGHYHPEKASGLCITTLRALRNQTQEDGRPYDVSYSVFRSRFPQISQKALEVMKKQAAYRIPYDEKRLDEKLKREEFYDGKDFMKLGMDSYANSGIFRSIKYAARYPHPFTRTRGTGIGRGLTCSMAVILAYQVAELYLDDKITPINSFLNEWPSDKYAASSPTHSFHNETYSTYLTSLKDETTEPRNETGLKLSINFWKGQEAPQSYRHKTYPLDCKVVGAEGMNFYMQANPDAWESLGTLMVDQRRFSIDEKVSHKQKLLDSYQTFIATIQKEVEAFPITCSPAPSPSPAPLDKSDLWWNKKDIRSRIEGLEVISEKELEALKTTDLRDILKLKAQQFIHDISFKDLSIVMGLLLNRDCVNHILIAESSMDVSPLFYPNRETCYQDIPHLLHPLTEKIRPTMLFYLNQHSLGQHSYFIFVEILFKEFIEHLKTMPDADKINLILAITQLGRDFIDQKRPADAISMYQITQLIYCLLIQPTTAMHERMLQLTLLKIQAFNEIAKLDSAYKPRIEAFVTGEKIRAQQLLDFMKKAIEPKTYEKFTEFPVVTKIQTFTSSVEAESTSSLGMK